MKISLQIFKIYIGIYRMTGSIFNMQNVLIFLIFAFSVLQIRMNRAAFHENIQQWSKLEYHFARRRAVAYYKTLHHKVHNYFIKNQKFAEDIEKKVLERLSEGATEIDDWIELFGSLNSDASFRASFTLYDVYVSLIYNKV